MSIAIRTATTRATCSVRMESNERYFSDGSKKPLIRTALNVKQLMQILKFGQLQDDSEAEEQRPIKFGKKRAAPPTTSARKRAKAKAVSPATPDALGEGECVHVYSHMFELGYTRNKEDKIDVNGRFADDKRAEEVGWLQEEADLINVLSTKSQGTPGPCTFDLGHVTVGEHWSVMQIFHGSPRKADDDLYFIRPLLTLPSVWFSDQNFANGSVLATCYDFVHSGRAAMSASANLVFLPDTPPPDLPIQIAITIHVSLIIPAIYSPSAFSAVSTSSFEEKRRRLLSYIFFPQLNLVNGEHRERDNVEEASIRRFYSILEPAPPVSSPVIHDALQPEGLSATLLPFQRRSVSWLLEREGMMVDSMGQVVAKTKDAEALPLFWQRVQMPATTVDQKGKSAASSGPPKWWYYNRLTGSLQENMPPSDDVAGAMLCEEMGLGKTLECIALILLNPSTDRNPTDSRWDPTTELEVSQVKTNLIVTPATLSQQWMDEITRHAPGLKVLSYQGYNKVKLPKVPKPNEKEAAAGSSQLHRTWCSYIHSFDIVVTTYNVLQAELGVAKAPITRPKRAAASYSHVEKPRSPLVRVQWLRVLMDEVQLVGGGKTAEMVSLIPRAMSIAVSGTPARSKVSDLSHVLKFLRVEQAIGSNKTWERLLKPEFTDFFTNLFRTYAIRTLKKGISQELTIPPQRRFAVGIDLGRVEKHIYDETLQEALDELGVDAHGVAASEGWEIDISLLRSWLRRLRQICTHPQVGALHNNNNNKPAAKGLGTKTIKTIAEVLQGLQNQNFQALSMERKSKIQCRMRRAQLMQKVDGDLNCFQASRDLLLSTQTETNELIEDIKAVIAAHEERGRQIKEEAATKRRERKQLDVGDGAQISPSKGKEKAREVSIDVSSNEDSETEDLPNTQVGDEHRVRQRTLQARLREGYILQHKVAFLLGDVYHALGPSHSHAEDAAYATAEMIRRTLLKTTEEAAVSAMAKLTPEHLSDGVRAKDLELSRCQKGGIRSAHLMEEANDVLDLLNEQGDLIWRWRARIFTLLTQKLSSSEGEQADGEEYARALDAQGEVEVYLQAYAALIADRKEGMLAERTALATHEARETKQRRTRAARNAEASMDLDDSDSEDFEIEPEHIVLQQELAEERRSVRDEHETRALKAIMFLLSEIGNRAGDRSEENQIAREEGQRLRKIITDQGTAMDKLELELATFRKVFNERIQYFKQLQELSDTVTEAEWDGDVRNAIESSKTEEDKLQMTVNAKRARQRHLDSIAKDQAEGELEQEQDCILCRCSFQRGVFTQCAHLFCEPCLTQWLSHRGARMHADCPVCRSNIEVNALQRISINDEDFEKQLERRGETTIERPVVPGRAVRFNALPQQTLDEIQTFEAHGSYGSKITHLVRHLLFLQSIEPGTKSVIFSAWSDSLTIIERALIDNGISSIRVDQKGQNAAQRFKTDPGILVFLLHGERENAGLNLTCAKRVWLTEPTVNHSFEVQAISRVDRMGQTAATEVFCYYIQDTVEENILRMGARRGLSLYTQDRFEDAIDISEFAMGAAKPQVDSPSKKVKQKGDFVEKAEDLIHVLFPHLDYRDEDFVSFTDVPHEGDAMDVEEVVGRSSLGSGRVNAEAGPSRLR